MGKKTIASLEKELAEANQENKTLKSLLLTDNLRASEEKYRLLAENISDVVWILDTASMKFKYISPSVEKLRGYTVEEELAQGIEERISPQSINIIKTKFPRRMANFLAGDPSAVTKTDEILQPRKDGSTVWTEVVSTIIRNADGGLDILGVSRNISKRKQTEKALHDNEKRLMSFFENVESLIWIKDLEGHFIFVNKYTENVLGMTQEQIIDHTVQELFPQHEASLYTENDQKISEIGQSMEFIESAFLAGVPHTFSSKRFPIRDSNGTMYAMGAISTDITEREQNERRDQKHHEILELLTKGASLTTLLEMLVAVMELELPGSLCSILLMDKDEEHLLMGAAQHLPDFFNKAIHGIKIGNNIGPCGTAAYLRTRVVIENIEAHPYSDNYHSLTQKAGLRACWSEPIFSSKEAVLGTFAIYYPTHYIPKEDEIESIKSIVNLASIVIERKKDETDLSKSEEKYRSLAEELEQHVVERTNEIKSVQRRLEVATQAAELGIWDWNINSGQVVIDEQIHIIYGIPSPSFIRTVDDLLKYVHPDDSGALLSMAQTLTQGSPHAQTQYRIIRPDHSVRHIKAFASILFDQHNQPEHITGVMLDVTQDKETEETLRLANLELERAMRVKDEFLANMSHELRTPLNSILGISESLIEQVAGEINDKQSKYLRIISESGHHLLNLINDILDLSKIGADRLDLDITQFSAEAVCLSSLRMVRELAQKKRLNISFHLDERVKTIQGDERRLKQILVNLLSNAVKFSPEGENLGLEVTGNTEENQVTFNVWDTGIGISGQDLSRLFKPFVQLDNRLSREAGGTGLGLMLVSQLVRLHGGNVTVQSEPDKGSRFLVSLPWHLNTPSEPIEKHEYEGSPQTANQPAKNGSAKILLVEDTEPVILYMKDYLETKGYHITVARNGYEGVIFAKNILPDIILMDVQLPSMNGFEATRRIRVETSLKNIPIIALTALAMPGDREKCLQAGMNHYISKPIDLKELHKLLNEYIEHKGVKFEQQGPDRG